MTTFKHPVHSHLKDDYWTTSAPAPVGYVPEGQFVDAESNTAQGEIGSVPTVVEVVSDDKPAAKKK